LQGFFGLRQRISWRTGLARWCRVVAAGFGRPLVVPARLELQQREDVRPHSRGAMRPRLASVSPSLETRGRREGRVRAAPAVSCAKGVGKNAHEHTGSAESIRPSLRNGFTAYFAISSVRRALLPPSPAEWLQQAWRQRRAPEPRDFAVRSNCDRQSQLSRPPHPTARS
jgi:hypothetical protein